MKNFIESMQPSHHNSDMSGRIVVSPTSTILDRWEGLSETIEIWSGVINQRYMSEKLFDDTVREAVCDFFMKSKIAAVVKRCLRDVKMIKISEGMLTKAMLFDAIEAETNDAVVATLVQELVLPAFVECGMLRDNTKYSYVNRYGFKPVTAADMRREVAVNQLLNVAKQVKVNGLGESRNSVNVIAHAFGEAFRPVGLQMLEINDLSAIFDTFINAVRANIDPNLSNGALTGAMPFDLRSHRVTDALAHNMVFIKAALALPVGTDVTPRIEGWKLDRFGPIILAAIQSSERYAWVSRTEALRSYGLKKVRDVRGHVATCVLYRAAELQAISQSVLQTEDVELPSATLLFPTRDSIAEGIRSAYGSLKMSTISAVGQFVSALTTLCEAGWTGNRGVYKFDMSEGYNELTDIACMMSERLFVETIKGRVVSQQTANLSSKALDKAIKAEAEANSKDMDELWAPFWWYTVPTTEKALIIMNGDHNGTEVVTCDPTEVLMAANEFEPVENVTIKPQVLGPKAFDSHLMTLGEHVLIKVDQRYPFDVDVNGARFRGAISAQSLSSFSASTYSRIVRPHFNSVVVDAYMGVIMTAMTEIERARSHSVLDIAAKTTDAEYSGRWAGVAPNEELFALIRRQIANHILDLAEHLSPSFRKEVHTSLWARSVSGAHTMSADENLMMRARLAQSTMAACADVIALDFFLSIQGISSDELRKMMLAPEMVTAYFSRGSNRPLNELLV